MRRLTDEAHGFARQLLSRSRPALDRVADALLERETLTASELQRVTAGGVVELRPLPGAGAILPTRELALTHVRGRPLGH